MKVILRVLFALILLLSLAGCGRDLGLTASDGTYLQMKIRFPETGDSDTSRLIHSEADELTITLTYPDGTVTTAEFPRNENSEMTIQVDDLTVASGVVVKVTLGIEEYDLILTEATKTIDIAEGANSTGTMTMEPIDCTVSGTLVDSADQILANHTITVGSTDITTDASGNFTLTVNTADLADTMTFRVINGDTYDFIRTHLALLQNWDDLTLKTAPEIYLDFTVGCEQYPLPGTTYTIWAGGVGSTEVATGTADRLGRISYQNSSYMTSSGSHEIELHYNGLFNDQIISTPGAPGAVVSDVTMTPCIIAPLSDSGWGQYLLYKIDDITASTHEIKDIQSMITGFSYANNNSGINTSVVDYQRGKIYVISFYADGTNDHWKILILDGWDDATGQEVELFPDTIFTDYTYPDFSVQQMVVMEDGNILVLTTKGAFIFDTTTLKATDVWDNNSTYGFVCNGGYINSAGESIVLGLDRLNGTAAERQSHRIWTLGADNVKNLRSSLPAEYADFDPLDTFLITNAYYYLKSLFSWDSLVVSVNNKTTSNSGGSVVFFDPETWNTSGSPVENKPEGGTLDVVRAIGVLPNNKFYFIEDLDGFGAYDRIMELDAPDDSSIEFYEFYNNPSGGIQEYYALMESF